MIVGIIAENSYSGILHKALSYAEHVDLFELRLDYISNHNLVELAACLNEIPRPVILTLRGIKDNGFYKSSEQERLALINRFCELRPNYLDIEEHVPTQYLVALHNAYPGIKIIKSYHNYECMPTGELDAILQQMRDQHCSIYKIVGYAKSSWDCLTTLCFVKRTLTANPDIKLTAHCMGEFGEPSRILGHVMGNYFTYVSLGDSELEAKIGVIDIKAIHEIYNITCLNFETQIYGLIGSPVKHSQGHIYHNKNFAKANINAVYVKFDVTKEELKEFVDLIKQSKYLNFFGLSVTMPLKYEITKTLPYHDRGVEAINTVKIIDKKFYGTNTDGLGALLAVGEIRPLRDIKNICILGAGATATAIAEQALKNNIFVTIVFRTISKEKYIAELFHYTDKVCVNAISQDNLFVNAEQDTSFDVIINTLPLGIKNISIAGDDYLISAVVTKLSNNKTVFMDVNYNDPILVPNRISIDGYKMFAHQAQLQFNYWLKGQDNGN